MGLISKGCIYSMEDKRIMKRAVNQVEDQAITFGLGQQIQALSQPIESLMKAESQSLVPNSTPPYHTCDSCGCVHGPRECIVEGQLAQVMDELNYVRGRNDSYEQFSNNNNFRQGQSYKQRQNQNLYKPPYMQNQRPCHEERRPTVQEALMLYISQNDQCIKLLETQLSSIHL